GRRARHRARPGHRGATRDAVRLADADPAAHRRHRGRLLGAGRRRLRSLPGPQGVPSRPDRGAEVRMTTGILAGVLTLAEALATARAHQPQIVAAGAATEAAQARADEALAGVLPQVSGNANFQRSTANFTSRPGSLPSQISGSGGTESWTA